MSCWVGAALLARALDDELPALALRGAGEGLAAGLHPGGWLHGACVVLERWRGEALAAVTAIYHFLSIHPLGTKSDALARATPGMIAMGVEWSDPSPPSPLLYLLIFLEAYLSACICRIQTLLAAQQPGNLLESAVRALLSALQCARWLSLLNSALHICDGRFPSLAHRLTGMPYKCGGVDPAGPKPSQTFMETRKLAWGRVLGTAAAVAVCVDWRAVRAQLLLWAPALAKLVRARAPASVALDGAASSVDASCAACGRPPVNPHAGACQHAHCYLCLPVSTADEDEEPARCACCLLPLGPTTPWRPNRDGTDGLR